MQRIERSIMQRHPGHTLKSLDETDIDTLFAYLFFLESEIEMEKKEKSGEIHETKDAVLINGKWYKKVNVDTRSLNWG